MIPGAGALRPFALIGDSFPKIFCQKCFKRVLTDLQFNIMPVSKDIERRKVQ